jgi:prefoldin subunit 5
MTPEQRLDEIERIIAEMQDRIENLSANLDDVSSQLVEALKRIELLEEAERQKSRNSAMQIFKGRLN